MRIARQAARVVVTDPAGAVFLFRYENQEDGVYWTPPGGGLEPGESPEQGALRELREETGWDDLPLGPLLCRWEHDFTRAGVPVRQYEHIFLASGPHRALVGDLAAEHAADRIQGGRWWPPDELAAATDTLWPPQLPSLLTTVRTQGPPPTPLDLDSTLS
ncbi:NUDIX domain-containing protein [Streptomyces sp. NBC_00433]